MTWWEIAAVILFFLLVLTALVLVILLWIKFNKSQEGTFIVREDLSQLELKENAPTALLFSVGKYRNHISYSASTGTFKVHRSGIYNVSASFAISPAPAINLPVKAYALVNSTTVYGASQQQSANGFLVISFDTNIPLRDCDTFQIIGLSQGAGDIFLAPSEAEPTRVSVAKSSFSLC